MDNNKNVWNNEQKSCIYKCKSMRQSWWQYWARTAGSWGGNYKSHSDCVCGDNAPSPHTAHRRLHSVSFQWAKWKIFLLYWSPASCPRLRAAAAACEPSICQNGRSAKYLNPGLVLIRPLKHFGMFEHWSLPVPPLLLPPPSLPRTESRNKVENLKWMKAEDWSCLLLHAQFLILALLHHLTILPLTCNADITRKSHTSDTNILHTQKICSR